MEINYKFIDIHMGHLTQKSLKVLYSNKKGKDVCLQHESFNGAKIYHKITFFFCLQQSIMSTGTKRTNLKHYACMLIRSLSFVYQSHENNIYLYVIAV